MKLIVEEDSRRVLPANLLPIKNITGENSGSRQIQEYAEELLGYIEQINWEIDGISQIEEKDPAHPFHLVFEALKLVKWELDDLYQQRKSAEKALRKSEGNFRKIVEASRMGMHMYKLEADGRLVFTGSNPSADSILGIDNLQFVGKTIEEPFRLCKKRRFQIVIARYAPMAPIIEMTKLNTRMGR